MTAPDLGAALDAAVDPAFGDIKALGLHRSAGAARMTLHFDGGARPHRQAPGSSMMEIAVVTGGRSFVCTDIGEGDNCTAEWLALRYAVAIAAEAGARDVLFVGDARTIVEQALGRWRCRSPQLLPHYDAYRADIARFARVHVRHVPRSKNLAGIALARRHAR